ncbi:MAG: maleylpyruvate isomerase family protein [Dactylosporangium sp.]|nr:maleylpyruvate isomerase N-terminal domain-containing protein [Dactylosporangium sp.]NNJ62296.1 maleylpyruvate isomerase family protein [Dactylosporangium sp.]
MTGESGALDRSSVINALIATYGNITTAVEGLREAQLIRPSRCAGWTVGDVLYHVLLDARRALRTFVTPTSAEPDVDHVSYWRPFSPRSGKPFALGGAAAAAHARHVRIAASAYPPGALFWEWRETSAAACRAAQGCPYERVAAQGHVLGIADFVATLVVEAAVHLLDLNVGLPNAPAPDPVALELVRRVLDGLLETPVPVSWDDATYALKGTGRVGLTEEECFVLGHLAGQFPMFG